MSTALSLENAGSINHFVLGDQVLWDRRWSIERSESRGCFESEDVLFEETLLDELFQILKEGPLMDGLVSLTVMVGAIIFYFGKWGTVLDWSRVSNPRLVLEVVELQQSERFFHRIVHLERIWWKDREHMFLESRLSPFQSWEWVEASCGGFDFSLTSPCFTVW